MGFPSLPWEEDGTTVPTISRHFFGEETDDDVDRVENHAFYVDIIEYSSEPQNTQEEYGMNIWPCSTVLAEYLWQQRDTISGKNVVELGAGTALPGMVAAKLGANVVLTDNSDAVQVLDNMKRTSELNNVNCEIMGLTWGKWDAPIFSLRPQIVIGSDIIYDNNNFEHLFATVSFLLQRSPGSVFLAAYHNRSGHHLIEYLMVKWGWKSNKLLDAFSFMPSHKAAILQGNIQLVEIMLDNRH